MLQRILVRNFLASKLLVSLYYFYQPQFVMISDVGRLLNYEEGRNEVLKIRSNVFLPLDME
jgi:hypothetical protein